MAVVPGQLDELILHTEVNKAVVYRPVRSVVSQLSLLCRINDWGRQEAPDNYI